MGDGTAWQRGSACFCVCFLKTYSSSDEPGSSMALQYLSTLLEARARLRARARVCVCVCVRACVPRILPRYIGEQKHRDVGRTRMSRHAQTHDTTNTPSPCQRNVGASWHRIRVFLLAKNWSGCIGQSSLRNAYIQTDRTNGSATGIAVCLLGSMGGRRHRR